MKEARGYVQIAFEQREGVGLLEWLVTHGRKMTYTEAYLFIGYDCPKALMAKVRNHLPGFKFHSRPRVYTADVITKAFAMRANGKQWAEVAAECGPSIQAACWRYKVRLSKQPPRPEVSCTAKKRVG